MLQKFDVRFKNFRGHLTFLKLGRRYETILNAYLSTMASQLLFHMYDPLPLAYRYGKDSPVTVDYEDEEAYVSMVMQPNPRDLVASGNREDSVLDLNQQRQRFQKGFKRGRNN